MKLFTFFFFVATLQISAKAHSQSVNLTASDITLKKAFREIEKQTGYSFFINHQLLKEATPVSLTLKNATINEALQACLKDQQLTYAIIGKTVILKAKKKPEELLSKSLHPNIQVNGAVVDSATGQPLTGVTIKVKGTTAGTVTDAQGKFSLQVSDNAVLIVSYLGYRSKIISVNGRTNLNISLTATATGLNKLVVVGYSTKRQSELSSSVTVVSGEELNKGVTSDNIGSMLQGKVPGLAVSNSNGHPDREPNMVIGGVGSIGAGSSPLIVVDGIIGGSADPSDIASVTILKDAAATGLYGSRAANGVIVITTKHGANGKTLINFKSSVGPTFFNRGNLRMMNSAELYANRKEAAQNYYNDQVSLGNPVFTNQTFDQYLQSQIPDSVLNTNSYWPELLTRTGLVTKQHLSVSGGNDKTTFYLSGNYYHELGTLVGEKFDDYSLRANLSHQISKRVGLKWGMNGSIKKYPNDPETGQESVVTQYVINVPWDPVYVPGTQEPYNPYTSGPWWGNNKANYFYDSRHYSDKTQEASLNTDLKIDIKINDWISFSSSNRMSFFVSERKQLLDKYHFAASFEDGSLTQTYSYNHSFITSNLLTFDRSFNDNNFSFLLGQEYNYIHSANAQAVGVDIPVGLDALNATASPNSVSGNTTKTDFLSYFGQLNYNYLNRYFLVGSLRSDASSLFGSDNRWATFYSVGASWIISKENFLKDVSWLDLLKIKGSYGSTGNANIAPYLSLGTYVFNSNSTYNGGSGARPARLENKDLTWETSYKANIGLEVSILKRINFEVDFYNKISKNLLQSVPLAAATGFSDQERNVGSVQNRGVNINLNTTNINTRFKWETNLNISINRSKVLALNDGKDIVQGNMRIKVGLPLRYFYMREWAGVDSQTGDPLYVRWEDKNGDLINGADGIKPAKITTTNDYNSASLLFVATPYPDLTGGMINNFSYGRLSLSVSLNYVLGQMIYFSQRESIDDDGAVLSKNQMLPFKGWKRWEKPGDDATEPRLILGGNHDSNKTSSKYLENGSYLRIQNITLGYDFPHVFSGLSLFCKIDNPFTFSKFSGSNPSVNIENPVVAQVANTEGFAPPRRVEFGVSANF